jgi:hypothetical protein
VGVVVALAGILSRPSGDNTNSASRSNQGELEFAQSTNLETADFTTMARVKTYESSAPVIDISVEEVSVPDSMML